MKREALAKLNRRANETPPEWGFDTVRQQRASFDMVLIHFRGFRMEYAVVNSWNSLKKLVGARGFYQAPIRCLSWYGISEADDPSQAQALQPPETLRNKKAFTVSGDFIQQDQS